MSRVAMLGLVVALAVGTALAADVKKSDFVGHVVSIDTKAMTLEVESSSGTKTFSLESNIAVSEQTGNKKLELAQIKVGDRVKVMYTMSGEKYTASALERLEAPRHAANRPPKKY